MAHAHDPATTAHDTPFDPEFFIDMTVMASQSALAAIRRGDLAAVTGLTEIATEFALAAQRGLVVVR